MDGVNCNVKIEKSDFVMCDTTAAPSMITKCKPDLPEKIGNQINNFFMQSRKPRHFYSNLITTIGGIICYLRIQMQNQMSKCVTRLQRHLWSQIVNWIYLRRLATTSIILSCNLGNLIIFSPFFNFCNFRQFFAIFLRCENLSYFLPEKIGNHVNNFFMQSRKPHHFLLYLIATVLNDSLHFFMDQFCNFMEIKECFLYFYCTIYLQHNVLETNLINPWK